MTVFKKKTELAKGVFWPSYLIGIAVIVLGIANQKPFGSILDAGLNWVSDNFGWWFVLFALILVLLVFGLAFSKAGDVVIGGAGAKPEYTMWQWFSMSLKGGYWHGYPLLGDGRADLPHGRTPCSCRSAALHT